LKISCEMDSMATSIRDDLRWLRKTVDASAFPKAEIHLTEWSSSPSPRDHSHDSLPAATFVRSNVESTGLVDSLAYWVFTDVFEESAAGDSIFHGGFGLINFQGIVKPAFHAYRFLNRLGDEEIGRAPGIIATRDTASRLIRVLAYHYPSELREAPPLTASLEEAEKILGIGQAKNLHLEIQELIPGAGILVEILDASHGFCLPVWQEMGFPEPPTREQTQVLREAAWGLQRVDLKADAFGALQLDRNLKPWTVMMLTEVSPS